MNGTREFAAGRPVLLFLKHVLRKIFLEDWLLKLTALLITFGLWYGVSVLSKKGTATFAAQLVFRHSDDTVVMSAGVQDVRISVAGNDQLIGQLYGRKDLSVTADLTQTETGDQVVVLTPQNVSTNLPPGIKVDDVQPSRIAVKLEPLDKKDLPVEAALTGEPAAGFEVYSTTVTPAHAQVSGPQSVMETLSSVPTGAVDISGAKSDVKAGQMPIVINNPMVTVSNNSVFDVTVSIGEKRVERSFSLTANGKRITAALFGPRSILAKLKPTDIKVDIVKGDSGNDLPQLTLPESTRNAVEIRDVKLH
jgi:YbbR domain-containing protein